MQGRDRRFIQWRTPAPSMQVSGRQRARFPRWPLPSRRWWQKLLHGVRIVTHSVPISSNTQFFLSLAGVTAARGRASHYNSQRGLSTLKRKTSCVHLCRFMGCISGFITCKFTSDSQSEAGCGGRRRRGGVKLLFVRLITKGRKIIVCLLVREEEDQAQELAMDTSRLPSRRRRGGSVRLFLFLILLEPKKSPPAMLFGTAWLGPQILSTIQGAVPGSCGFFFPEA